MWVIVAGQVRSYQLTDIVGHTPHPSSKTTSMYANLCILFESVRWNLWILQALGRALIKKYLHVADNRLELACWEKFAVPHERLQLYKHNPINYRPTLEEGFLDISSSSASLMVKLAWNRAIIRELAAQASGFFQERPEYYAKNGYSIDWTSFFTERIYRYLFILQEARDGVMKTKYEKKKNSARLRQRRSHVRPMLFPRHHSLDYLDIPNVYCRNSREDFRSLQQW